jgi:hypothetical protein
MNGSYIEGSMNGKLWVHELMYDMEKTLKI